MFGSDGERVGALKEVGDANFVVDRGALRGEVCVLVDRIREVTSDGRIVLDVPADRVDETGRAKRIASRGRMILNPGSARIFKDVTRTGNHR